ncbi:hypothetical protein RhiJN_05219 [Ceratobasidium sp. AG-Ba]|nr:hypothetical protein RhiJN_05219 [Ceratobasidium sp. AG-Ba]
MDPPLVYPLPYDTNQFYGVQESGEQQDAKSDANLEDADYDEPSFASAPESDEEYHPSPYKTKNPQPFQLVRRSHRTADSETDQSSELLLQQRLPVIDPVTPSKKRLPIKTPGTKETIRFRQGIDRARIADFAVGYFKIKEGSQNIYGIPVPLLEPAYIPIIVEGKRPPSRRTAPIQALEEHILNQLAIAKLDITRKSSVFFSTSPNLSYIGIAFAGCWWCFTICVRGVDMKVVAWSKVFTYLNPPEHEAALDIIIHAAQNYPDNPEGDQRLLEFLRMNRQQEAALDFEELS